MRLFALFGAVLLSCVTPKAGAPCTLQDAYCAGPKTARVCTAGTLQDSPCPGPNGCSMDSIRNIRCDQSSGGVVGQPCFTDYEGKGQCDADGGTLLQCISGAWVGAACPQGTACHVDATGVLCR